MNSITINTTANTIEVSKKFAAKAFRYGTEEYKMLRDARADYPGFKVVEVARKASKSMKNTFKGLTYKYMEAYILAHDDGEQTKMKTYLNMRGETEEAEAACACSQSYMEIKEWFLTSYSEIAKFHEDRIAVVEAAQQKRAEARADRERKQKEARRNKLLSRKTN